MSRLTKTLGELAVFTAMTSAMLDAPSRNERVRPDTSVKPERLIPREKSEEERQRRREHKKKIKAKKNARRHKARR